MLTMSIVAAVLGAKSFLGPMLGRQFSLSEILDS